MIDIKKELKTQDAADYLDEVMEYLVGKAEEIGSDYDHLEHISGNVYRMRFVDGSSFGCFAGISTNNQVFFIPDNCVTKGDALVFGESISAILSTDKKNKGKVPMNCFLFESSKELSEADQKIEAGYVLLGLSRILRRDTMIKYAPDREPEHVAFINVGKKGDSNPHVEYYKYDEYVSLIKDLS